MNTLKKFGYFRATNIFSIKSHPPEGHVAEFWVVNELGIDAGPLDGLHRRLFLHRRQCLPAEAGGEDVGQKEGGALVLVPKDVEQQREALAHKLGTVVVGTHLQEVLEQLIYNRVQSQVVGRR